MSDIAGHIIEGLAALIVGFVDKGIQYYTNLTKEHQRQLQSLRKEVAHNITALDNARYDNAGGLKIATPEFKTLTENLEAAIAEQFYRDKRGVQTALKTAKGKKTKHIIRYTAYALDYTVKQIDSLKQLSRLTPGRRLPDIRLKRRLDTLKTHLDYLDKILAAIPVKLPPPKKRPASPVKTRGAKKA
jgi:hypothetical protein